MGPGSSPGMTPEGWLGMVWDGAGGMARKIARETAQETVGENAAGSADKRGWVLQRSSDGRFAGCMTGACGMQW